MKPIIPFIFRQSFSEANIQTSLREKTLDTKTFLFWIILYNDGYCYSKMQQICASSPTLK
jgi:hypothetical protein